MRVGDVNCAGCGETWSSKPSQIYLLNFVLPSLPIIKLGFSNNPLIRLGQVQSKPQETKGAIVRTIDMETGHRAICIEKALHTHIKAHRPDLIVPFGLFRSHIRTKSEIYYAHGRDYISKLLTAANAGWDPNHTADWQGFITA